MPALTIQNHLQVVEAELLRALRLAFLKRFPPVTDLVALGAAQIAAVDGGLVYVTSEANLFEWRAASQATPDGVNVIAMSGRTQPGRWHRVSSPMTYGPNGSAMLQAKADGFCLAVEAYNGQDDQATRIFAKTPSLLIQWVGDNPRRAAARPGRYYWNYISFNILIVAANYRQPPALLLGTSFFTDPPALLDLIGMVRYFLAGADTFIDGVEYVEIDAADIYGQEEDLAERVFTASVGITVKVSFECPDEDLTAFAAEVQPKLTQSAQVYDAVPFDPLNFVAAGYDLAVGLGFTRSYGASLATIGGVGVALTPDDVTLPTDSDIYRDLNPDGTITYVVVDRDTDAPTVTDGALRIARTRTDDSGVVADDFLCSRSVSFGPPMDIA